MKNSINRLSPVSIILPFSSFSVISWFLLALSCIVLLLSLKSSRSRYFSPQKANNSIFIPLLEFLARTSFLCNLFDCIFYLLILKFSPSDKSDYVLALEKLVTFPCINKKVMDSKLIVFYLLKLVISFLIVILIKFKMPIKPRGVFLFPLFYVVFIYFIKLACDGYVFCNILKNATSFRSVVTTLLIYVLFISSDWAICRLKAFTVDSIFEKYCQFSLEQPKHHFYN